MSELVELDALEVVVIVDNEVDPISTYANPGVKVSGQLPEVATRSPLQSHDRAGALAELRMDKICCGAHGLSLMITAIKGDERHTVLFDTGPEEIVWEQNVTKLQPDLSKIELIHLSHWHRDHSGGMLKAISMIQSAKSQANSDHSSNLIVDLHPNRPTYRGFSFMQKVISVEADPTFAEIESTGVNLTLHDQPHSICNNTFMTSGFIPRVTSYETGLLRGMRFNDTTKAWEADELIADERLLMCKLKDKGVIVFTGCSHAGAINTSKHAIELAGGNVPLYAVVGGYHLVGPNEAYIKETVQDFKKLDPTLLLPGHCSGWKAKFEIEKEMPGRLAPSTVGTRFTF